ncbi:helix-turn-helix domain-containing protein [Bacillus velezensis]
MTENKNKTLGPLLKSLLDKHSLSMRKLGALTNIDTATISRIINGKQKANLKHLQEFSKHLRTPLEELLEASGIDIGHEKEAAPQDPMHAIQDMLNMAEMFDQPFSREQIERELTRYEQYTKTQQGHRLICDEFQKKMDNEESVGPFIDHLKNMHHQYMDESTPAEDRAILGSALLYYILATDVIPDYMFPIGYLDDAIAVQIALNRLKKSKGA